MKMISAAIEEETKITDIIINKVLEERKVQREMFDSAVEMYKNDIDVISLMAKSIFEPTSGVEIGHQIVDKVLKYEEEHFFHNNPIQKCIFEDEIWEMFNVEIGDVRSFAKARKINLNRLRQWANY
jgi:hypothetical protein